MDRNYSNTSDNFDHFVTPWDERVSCAILFSTLSLIGMLANALAVSLSIFTDLRHRKVNLLIGNLAASDFMCSGVFLLGQNFYILYRETMPVAGCEWLGFFNFIAALQEFVFPPFLAVNRYIGLYHQAKYDTVYTGRNLALMICGSWIFCTIVPMVFMLNGHTGYDRQNEHCCLTVDERDVGWTVAYWLIIIVPLLGVCDSTMVFCDWKIYKKLAEHAHQHGALLKKTVISENKEILYFMVIDMLMPICAHSTYHVAKFAYTSRFSLASRQLFTCLYLGNAVLRGFIILLMLRPYRVAVKRLFGRGQTNQVVPALTQAQTGRYREV